MHEVIKSSEGFILTNGEIYGTEIWLGLGVSGEDFYEIPIAEYEALINSEEAMEEDYQAALGEMGVKV